MVPFKKPRNVSSLTYALLASLSPFTPDAPPPKKKKKEKRRAPLFLYYGQTPKNLTFVEFLSALKKGGYISEGTVA